MYCSKCGAANTEGTNFCVSCGAAIPPYYPLTPPENTGRGEGKSKIWIPIVIASCAVALVLIFGILLVFTGVFTKVRTEPEVAPTDILTAAPDYSDSLPITTSQDASSAVAPSDEPPQTQPDEASPDAGTDADAAPKSGTQVESVFITYANAVMDDISGNVGYVFTLKVLLKPANAQLDGAVIWSSSDTSVFTVTPDDSDGMSATITIVGSGSAHNATLTVRAGEAEAQCIIRVI